MTRSTPKIEKNKTIVDKFKYVARDTWAGLSRTRNECFKTVDVCSNDKSLVREIIIKDAKLSLTCMHSVRQTTVIKFGKMSVNKSELISADSSDIGAGSCVNK